MTEQHETDLELLIRYSQGDMEGFQMLYQRYRKPLFTYLVNQAHHQQSLAEDIFQRLWVRLIEHSDELCERGSKEPGFKLVGWLYTTARNALIDEQRRAENRNLSFEQITEEDNRSWKTEQDTTQPLEEQQQGAQLKQAIAQLPDKLRDVIYLMLNDVDRRDIATILGLNIETVKTRRRYALEQLRTLLPQTDGVLSD